MVLGWKTVSFQMSSTPEHTPTTVNNMESLDSAHVLLLNLTASPQKREAGPHHPAQILTVKNA